jgi:hypothetical protein
MLCFLTKFKSTLHPFGNLGAILYGPANPDILSILHHIILKHCKVVQNVAKFCEDYKVKKSTKLNVILLVSLSLPILS